MLIYASNLVGVPEHPRLQGGCSLQGPAVLDFKTWFWDICCTAVIFFLHE